MGCCPDDKDLVSKAVAARRRGALQAILKSAVPRDDIFITSKIHPRHLGFVPTMKAFEASLRDFHTDYLDLLLLHYPACSGSLCTEEPAGNWRESWRAMEELVRKGQVLALGALARMQACSCLLPALGTGWPRALCISG